MQIKKTTTLCYAALGRKPDTIKHLSKEKIDQGPPHRAHVRRGGNRLEQRGRGTGSSFLTRNKIVREKDKKEGRAELTFA